MNDRDFQDTIAETIHDLSLVEAWEAAHVQPDDPADQPSLDEGQFECGYCGGAGYLQGACRSGQDDRDCPRCNGTGILDYECESAADEAESAREFRESQMGWGK